MERETGIKWGKERWRDKDYKKGRRKGKRKEKRRREGSMRAKDKVDTEKLLILGEFGWQMLCSKEPGLAQREKLPLPSASQRHSTSYLIGMSLFRAGVGCTKKTYHGI